MPKMISENKRPSVLTRQVQMIANADAEAAKALAKEDFQMYQYWSGQMDALTLSIQMIKGEYDEISKENVLRTIQEAFQKYSQENKGG